MSSARSCHLMARVVVITLDGCDGVLFRFAPSSAAMGDPDVELDAVTSSRDVARIGVGLRVGTAITITQASGAMARLFGITGTLVGDGLIKSSQGLPSLAIQCLNTDTGICDTRVASIECTRRHTLVMARRVTSAATVRALSGANDVALSSHFARRCIAAIFTNWPAHVPLTIGGWSL